jgi:peptide/nickel transport system permease protein
VLTILGIQLGRMFGGAVVVESVYAWPGLGRLLVTGISARDYPVVQGTLLLMAIVFIVINLATDVAYGIVDPRIRLSKKG